MTSAVLTGFGADGAEDDQRCVTELCGLFAAGAELGDGPGVPIVHSPD